MTDSETALPFGIYRVTQRTFTEISGGKISTTASLLRREGSVGICFRLVHGLDSGAKCQAFERALAKLRSMERMC